MAVARLDGHELRCHKRSNTDGSGKFSVVPSRSDAVVSGALFSIPEDEKHRLDGAEGLGYGYDERAVAVMTSSGTRKAFTYVAAASHVDNDLIPFTWYRDLAAEGAASLGLSAAHVAFLRGFPSRPDPDAGREASERAFIPCGGTGAVRPTRPETP